MFSKMKNKLIKKVETLEDQKEKLEDERTNLKCEVNELKSQKKIEEEQIKHLVKIKDEKRDIEFQKKDLERDAAKAKEVEKIKDGYRDKIEANLELRNKELKEMYVEILGIVPKVEALVEIGTSKKKSK